MSDADTDLTARLGELATETTFLNAYASRRMRRHHDVEVLSFAVGGETYGIEISCLREISRVRAIAEVPRVPAFLIGVLTLRGRVLPVIDLRRRLGLGGAPAADKHARILVASIDDELYGLLVDRVFDVERLQRNQVEPDRAMGGAASDLVTGVARTDDALIILLDVAAVVRFDVAGAQPAGRDGR